MTIFDLLFIVAFLALVLALATAAYQAIRGRFARAGSILLRTAVSTAIYLGVVVMVSLSTPRRVMRLGDERCFDDWCFAVANATHTPSASGVSYSVQLRLFSRAKGRPQRASDALVYLVDATNHRFAPASARSEPPLNVLLGPGESVTTTRVFTTPPEARDVGLVLEHGGSGPGPVIIGDDLSLFHKRTVVRLE